MGYSKLTDKIARPKYKKWTTRAGASIDYVVVHHWAATGMGGYERLVNSKDQASANYMILNDGTLIGSVDELYRAWTSGSWTVDRRGITIEIQDQTGSPYWRISDAAIETLISLIVDIAKRYRWNSIGPNRVRGHREFAQTACPGPYLWPRLKGIAATAQARWDGKTDPVKETPSKPKPAKKKPVDKDPTAGKGKAHEWPEHKLREDGDDGKITYRAYQRLLAPKEVGNYTGLIDGDFEKLSIKAEQRWLKKLGYYKGRIDGVRGSMTIKALQAKLYDDGFYRNGRYSKKTMVDGKFEKLSVIGLQKYLNSQRKYYND